MRKFETSSRIHASIYRLEIDYTRPVTSDIRRVMREVLQDLDISDVALENTDPTHIAMTHRNYSYPIFNHDPEMQGLYEYDPDRDRIVLNAEIAHLWEERVAYRVLYCAVLERQFFLDMKVKVEELGLAAFLDGRGPMEEHGPWLPRLAQFKKAKRTCKVPEDEVVAWRTTYQRYLLWDDPGKVMARRALMHAVEKEHCEERAYRLVHTPELFEEEYVPIWKREE